MKIHACARLAAPLFAALFFAGNAGGEPALEERRQQIRQIEATASPEALARKERSEALLRAEGVPVNPHLPAIQSAERTRHRSQDEVAFRAMALLVVAVKAEGLERPLVEGLVREYGLAPHFTPKERAFLAAPAPDERDRLQFGWKYEAAWPLLWALGFVDKLDKPAAECDAAHAMSLLKQRTRERFLNEAKLRPLDELLDQADRIYRYHWAIEEARVHGKPAPAGLHPDVTMERHHALNWLVGYLGQEWDDVTTDT